MFGLASMGPRVFTRGNTFGQGTESEAGPVLQWGHASSRVETRGIWYRRRRRNRLQWGHASSRVETTPLDEVRLVQMVASMGPRVFTRGNTVRTVHS